MSERDHRDFRQVMGSLAGGVTVISCRVNGQDHAMTATAVTSVSLSPPLILVCVARAARFWEAISSADHWAVSVLAGQAEPHAAWLATPGRPLVAQLDQVPHHRSAAGCALLDDALGWVECRTHSQTQVGDHDIVVGEVMSATMGDGTDPLIYWRSHYRGASEVRSDAPGDRYS